MEQPTIFQMALQLTTLESTDQKSSLAQGQGLFFDLHFMLTRAEWKEAGILQHPIMGASAKLWIRLFCGLCAAINLTTPWMIGISWSALIRYAPAKAAILAVPALSCACWAIWMNALDHRLNRLDLERHIVLDEERVTITWNQRTFNYQWKDFIYFRESSNLVVLRNPGARFRTIPLRVVPSGSQSQFHELLRRRLARRQPYSWSPDTSGIAH